MPEQRKVYYLVQSKSGYQSVNVEKLDGLLARLICYIIIYVYINESLIVSLPNNPSKRFEIV